MNNGSRHFYLCPPKYYKIEYIINDWMNPGDEIDQPLAIQQWESLYETYQKLGVNVNLIDPVEGIPELTFAGDAIFIFGKNAIASQFRHQERQPEVEPQIDWFSNLGYSIHHLPDGLHFEGNAELLLWGDVFLGGCGIRSDCQVYDFISKTLDVEIITLELSNPFYHLDTSLCPIDNDTIAYAPSAFDKITRKKIDDLAKNIIRVDEDEARNLACNSKVIGDNIILSSKKTPKFVSELQKHGLNTFELDLGEFKKAGAGAKCLTLEAYQPK